MLPQNLVLPREDQVRDISHARDLLERVYKTRYESTIPNDMTLHDDGTVEFLSEEGDHERLLFTQGFLESLAGHIRMPLNYAYVIRFGLFRENVQRRKGPCSCGLTLCITRDTVINTAPVNYRLLRAPSVKMLERLSSEDGAWEFEKAFVSDEGVSINLLHSTHTIEPQPGDIIRIGLRITNSETGGRYAKATAYTQRLVCSNGAVIPDKIGNVWWPTDKRMHKSTRLTHFGKKIGALKETVQPATADAYDAVTDRPVYERDFVRLHRRMHYALRSAEQTDRILGVMSEDRSRLQARVRELDPADAGEATPWLVFDLQNRVTAAAREIMPSSRSSRFSLRERLEEIGGDLLFVGRN